MIKYSSYHLIDTTPLLITFDTEIKFSQESNKLTHPSSIPNLRKQSWVK